MRTGLIIGICRRACRSRRWRIGSCAYRHGDGRLGARSAHRRARVPRASSTKSISWSRRRRRHLPPAEPDPEPEAPKPVRAASAATQKDEPLPRPHRRARSSRRSLIPTSLSTSPARASSPATPTVYAGGVTADNGTSKNAVRNRNAAPGGVQGGTGTKAGPTELPSGPDLSHPASVAGGADWDCPFPAEADADQIDLQRVPIIVTVATADGRVKDVKVMKDPGPDSGARPDSAPCARA